MTSMDALTPAVRAKWPLTHPLVKSFSRQVSKAQIAIADEIEYASNAGMPADVIAIVAGIPLSEVKLILQEAAMSNDDEDDQPPGAGRERHQP